MCFKDSITYPSQPLSPWSLAESYLDPFGQRYEVVESLDNRRLVKIADAPKSLVCQAIKIASYVSVILPLIALAIKGIHRYRFVFTMHPSGEEQAPSPDSAQPPAQTATPATPVTPEPPPENVSAEEVEKRLSRMDELLNQLNADISNDISNLSAEEFSARIDHQFEMFSEICDLRSSLKRAGKTEGRFETIHTRLKNWKNSTESFQVAHRLKHHDKTSYPTRQILISLSINSTDFFQLYENRDTLRSGTKNSEEWKTVWRKVQKGILSGFHRARPITTGQWTNRHLVWITGTNSSTLVSALANPIKELGGPALVPTGELLMYNIVPVAGELVLGIAQNGVNLHYLSGTSLRNVATPTGYSKGLFANKLDSSYPNQALEDLRFSHNRPKAHYFRIKLYLLRLLFARRLGICVDAHIEEAKQIVTAMLEKTSPPSNQWRFASSLVGIQEELPEVAASRAPVLEGAIVGLVSKAKNRLDFVLVTDVDDRGNFSYTTATGEEKYSRSNRYAYTDEELRDILQKHNLPETLPNMETQMNAPLRTRLEELLNLLNDSTSINIPELAHEDRALIENPVPIVFGSFSLTKEHLTDNIEPTTLQREPNMVNDEIDAIGPQLLGQDIQVIFTPEEHLANIRQYTEQHSSKLTSRMHCISLKVLPYLAAACPDVWKS